MNRQKVRKRVFHNSDTRHPPWAVTSLPGGKLAESFTKRGILTGALVWTAAASLGCPADVTAQVISRTTRKGLSLVNEIRKGLKEYLELSQAANDVLDGHLPPPSSSKGRKLAIMLERNKAELEGLSPDGFRVAMPSLGNVPTNLEGARSYIETFVDNIQQAAGEYDDVRDAYMDDLDDIDDALSRLDEISRKVTEVLEQLLGLPLPEGPVLKAGHIWLDMVTVAQPLIGDCQAVAANKRRQANSIFNARGLQLRDHAGQVLSALAVEQAVLQGEASRLEQLLSQLKTTQDAFDKEARAIVDLGTILDARRRDIESLEFHVNSQTRELQQVLTSLNDVVGRERSLRTWLGNWKANWRCSKGYTWAECTSHQSEKDDYQRNYVTPNQNKLNAAISEESGLLQRKRQIQADLDDTRRSLSDYQQRLSVDQATYDRRSAAHGAARVTLENQRTTTMKEVWTSRANVLASASRADTAAIQATLGGLK